MAPCSSARRASWNWPVSCLGHRAFSKVNKQIRRSWGRGQKAGHRGTAPCTPAPWPQVAWSRERGTGRLRPHPLSFADPRRSRTSEGLGRSVPPVPALSQGLPPERKPRSQGPPAGIPGQGRQQLTAERALGWTAVPWAPVPAVPPRRADLGKEVRHQLQQGLRRGCQPGGLPGVGLSPVGKGMGTRVKQESEDCSDACRGRMMPAGLLCGAALG